MKVIYPNDNGGDIILLPNRREIAVTDGVSEKTRQGLARVSHLVDSSVSIGRTVMEFYDPLFEFSTNLAKISKKVYLSASKTNKVLWNR